MLSVPLELDFQLESTFNAGTRGGKMGGGG